MGIGFRPLHALYIFMLCATGLYITNCMNYIHGRMYIGKDEWNSLGC